MYITRSFSWNELLKSQTAARRGIDNVPTAAAQENIIWLCENVLQPLRDKLASPLTVTSGYRSRALCEAIGSSVNSRHCLGLAADIECFSIPTVQLAYQAALLHLPLAKIILECYDDEGDMNSGWVHLGAPRPGDDVSGGALIYEYNRVDGYRELSLQDLTEMAGY